MARGEPVWVDDIFAALRDAAVRQVAYVPDAGFARLIDLCRADADMTAVPLTTEEEGVALLAGAWLGGRRGVLLMQSSGVGNCINMLSLATACRFPLLMIATMRGQWGEVNPWQVPMGRIAGEVLRLTGAIVHEVDEADRVGETVAAAARSAFDGPAITAVLISQRLVAVKRFGK